MQDPKRIGTCACGEVRALIHGDPLMRVHCHCTTCQAFNDAPSADVTVFDARDIVIEGESNIAFKAYQKNSPVLRGRCTRCQSAVIEKASMPLLPNLIMMPSEVIQPAPDIQSSQHIFYHRRTADADDQLPKRTGLVSSQGHFMKSLLAALWRRKRA
ncbi:MAG: GFA family protein [Burkholderiaceae bacterium]